MSVCRPYPPPVGWKTIERISPANCTWQCEYHGINQVTRDIVSKKIQNAKNHLELLEKQLAILETPEEKQTNETVYNYDYKIKVLSRPKYQALVKVLDHEELQTATRKRLKDRETFLKFPHCLTNRCDNSTFYVAPIKNDEVVRSEYEDTISKNGLNMVKASQQFLFNYEIFENI